MLQVRDQYSHAERGEITHNHAYEYTANSNHVTSKNNIHAELQVFTQWLMRRGGNWLLQMISECQPCSLGCQEDLQRFENEMGNIDIEVYYFTPYSDATKKQATQNLLDMYIMFGKIRPYYNEKPTMKNQRNGGRASSYQFSRYQR
ncbi:MAG: hypothetical protein AAGA83_05110 [Cyanobacteria bacterium P01_F01_bin.116]